MNEATKAVVSWYTKSWQKRFVKEKIAYQIKDEESIEERADLVMEAFNAWLDDIKSINTDIENELLFQGLKLVDWLQVQAYVGDYLIENHDDFYPVAPEDREVI